MGGWPYPLDAVQGFFTSIFGQVYDWIMSIPMKVKGFIDFVGGEIRNKIDWIKNQIWGFVTWLYDELYDGLVWVKDQLWGMIQYQLNQMYQILLGIPGAIGKIASQVWSMISPAFASLWNQVWGGLKWVWSMVSPALTNLWNQVWGGLKWVWSMVPPALSSLWNQVWGGLQWASGEIGKGISDAKDKIWGWFTWLWKDQIKPGLDWVWNKIPTFDDIRSMFDGAFSGAWEFLTKGFEPLLQFFKPDYWTGLLSKFTELLNSAKGIADGWVSQVFHEFTHASPMTPEEAASRVSMAVPAALVAQVGVDVIGIIAELVGLTQMEIPWWAMNSMLRTVGIEGICSRILMERMEKAVLVPYGYYVNREARPYIPRPYEATEQLFHGQIQPEKWFDIMAYHGWPTEEMTRQYNVIDRVPTVMNLFRIAEVSPLDPAWTMEQLSQGHFRGVEQDKIMDAIQRYPWRDEAKALRSKLITEYAAGRLPEGLFIEVLSGIQQKPEELALSIRTAQLAERANAVGEMIDLQLASFQKEQITDKQLYDYLVGYGMSPERASTKVARERVKKIKLAKLEEAAEQKGIYASYVITRLKEGFIDETGFTNEMAQLTWGPGLIEETLKAARLAYDTEYKKELVTIYRDARYKELLTSGELDDILKPIVVVDARRAAIVAREEIRALPRPKAPKTPAPA